MLKSIFVLTLICFASACGNSKRAQFIEGCTGPFKGAIEPEKAEKMCGCIFDKGTAKWGLDTFAKKAVSQDPAVQSMAMECMKVSF